MNDNNITLVHSDEYRHWRFSASSPTQGVRFQNAHDLMARRHGSGLRVIEPDTSISLGLLEEVHDPGYVSRVLQEHRSGEWAGAAPGLARLAGMFAQGTLTALGELLSGSAEVAVHWPGAKHHAQYDHSSGFCVFADFALAATLTTEMGMRVAVLDFDAHHGDGTEALLLGSTGALTLSMHEYGIFPGTGGESHPESGALNWPLEHYTGDREALASWDEMLAAADAHQPDIIFVAAGADAHETDPLSSLQFTIGAYREMGVRMGEAFPSAPVLIGGAGGYQPHDITPVVWADFAAGVVEAKKL